MSKLGMPDLGLATPNDMRDNAAMIASINPSTPLIADADTGFGSTCSINHSAFNVTISHNKLTKNN